MCMRDRARAAPPPGLSPRGFRWCLTWARPLAGPTTAPAYTAPVQPTAGLTSWPFTGRQREVEAFAAAQADPECVGVVAIGEPGTGTTRFVQECADRAELAGSVADLGVLVPIAVALIVSNGLSPTAVLLPAGLLYVISGLLYRVRGPVQALKAFGAIAIAQGLGAPVIAAGAVLMGGVFVVLGIKWLLRDRRALGTRGSLMISLGQDEFGPLEDRIKAFMSERLKSLSLQSMSIVDERVNLQYQFKQQPSLDWTALVNDLNHLTAPAKVEIFVG